MRMDAEYGTEERAQLARAMHAQTVTAKAARRAARLSMIAWGAASALLILLTGALDIWVTGRWLWFVTLSLSAFLSFRVAAWIEKSGPVRARPARHVVLATSALGLIVGLFFMFTVGPGSGMGAYAIGASCVFGAGLLGAWWVGR